MSASYRENGNGTSIEATPRRRGRPRKVVAPDGNTPELKTGQVRVFKIGEIQPSPDNEKLYRPVLPDDPEILELAKSIGEYGIKDALTISLDGYIISGHRRYVAAQVAGLEVVPCVVEPINHDDPQFLILLRECNRQRIKSFDEVVRERVLDANAVDPDEAYAALLEHRRAKAKVTGENLIIEERRKRSKISRQKLPMLNAAIEKINEKKDYWPLSDREIHYDLLNDPPLKRSTQPHSRYQNDEKSYKNLCDLLTRARLEGYIPHDAIEDPTRSVVTWNTSRTVGDFIKSQLDGFLNGYFRDLQQSQPNHIEITGEKNTIIGSIEPIAMEFCIPYTLGRGYCSLDPRKKMARRFKASGKEKLIILILSDFDPEGEDIAHTFAQSMRDDFGIKNLIARKVCLTYEQVKERNLPQTYEIKKKGSRYKKFAAKYGDRAHELEALTPSERSRLLREAIDEVLDVESFNRELDAERADSARLAKIRMMIGPVLLEAMKSIDTDSTDPNEPEGQGAGR